jgi:hypothetical protein
MPSPRSTLSPLLLLFALAAPALAQDDPASRAAPGDVHQGLDQAVYKGLVGNVLDAIPMDPSKRLDLQRTNAVVGNTLLGRSLAVLAGMSNPVLLLGGFVWGVWAAANIKPAEPGMKLAAVSRPSGGDASTQARLSALLAPAAAVDDPPARSPAEPMLLSSISAGDADEAVTARPQVIKIWLPQRAQVLAR